MLLEAPGVRIADVETCDFGLMPAYDTATVLRAARPEEADHYLKSSLSRRLIAEQTCARSSRWGTAPRACCWSGLRGRASWQ